MSPWATDAEIITVGFGADLQRLLPTARITHMRQASHAVRDLAERLLAAHQLPDEAHQPYLICATTLEANAAWLLAEAVDSASHVPVAVIAPADGTSHLFPDAETLDASETGLQHVDSVDTAVKLQRLEQAAYQQIITALAVANEPPTKPEGAWEHVPEEPDDLPEPQKPDSPLPRPTASAPVQQPAGTPSAEDSDASDARSDSAYPALVAASSDPAGLRVLPASGEADEDASAGPVTDTTEPDPSSAAKDTLATPPLNEGEAVVQELHAPELRVLGPVEVTGVDTSGHGPRMAQLAALLYFKPDRDADTVCADMDPITPWERSTLNSRMRGLRTRLGTDADGDPYVPRRTSKGEPYRISTKLRCDWDRYQQLAERGLPAGASGLGDLEQALALVRGRPFGPHPLPWSEPLQQEMILRITDVAHTVATLRTPAGPHQDLTAARHAVTVGLDVDESAELLYRDWMRIEHTAGNRSGLHTAITRIQTINRALHVDPEPETEALITDLLNTPSSPSRTSQAQPTTTRRPRPATHRF